MSPRDNPDVRLCDVSGATNNLGVAQSYVEAARWWRKAAVQGVTKVLFILGVMYYIGKGVAQSDMEVMRWYRKAVD